ncbi:hypothetical protein PCANC_17810 [Puccinia coronata f. sp. avenae]|uniref:Uncharacterized protein n=1 Tax=Puccinia coronata f. sp. avenae TaxID=200324 RepID=A0A2N5SBQ9_9BASI|nr:hypothetical protein PCANC_17810 [Puccinia coronata f. sp. avenae]
MWQSDRTNHTAKFQMPSSTVCQGGVFKDKCLMRIRCGWKLRFGGCFVMKTPSSPPPLQLRVLGGTSSPPSNSVDSLAARVFDNLRSQGAIAPVVKKLSKHRSMELERRADLSTSQVDAVAAKVIQLMKQNNMALVVQKAKAVLGDEFRYLLGLSSSISVKLVSCSNDSIHL